MPTDSANEAGRPLYYRAIRMPRSRRHVFLICIDALRYDCVNWQPEQPYFKRFNLNRRLDTPTLDRLAEGAVRFPRAVSHAGYTPLSIATTLTGAYARAHGVVDFQNTTLRESVAALPTLFKRGGWRTASAFGPDFFETIGLSRDVDHAHNNERPLLEMLERDPQTPTFAFVHFNDVHSPYGYFYWDDPQVDNRDFAMFMWLTFGLQCDLSRREFVDAQGRRLGFEEWDRIVASPLPEHQHAARCAALFRAYVHGVQKFDQTRLRTFVERLQAAGVWDDAIVVLFADHGEIVAPRLPYTLGHGKFVLDQLLRVPLLVRAPGFAPRDAAPLVGLADLAPTLLELAGLAPAECGVAHAIDGVSLVSCLTGGPAVQQEYYQEGWSVLVAAEKRRPVLYQRALRRQDDVKYLLTGNLMHEREVDAVPEDEFPRAVIERALGEIAHESMQAEIRKLRQAGTPRDRIAISMAARTPRFMRYDLASDPFEEQGVAMSPAHADWRSFAAGVQRMAAFTGRPHFPAESALSPAQEARLLHQLSELGYVEV